MATKKRAAAKTAQPAAAADTMRVEITEKSLKDAGMVLSDGDRVTVPAEVGRRWCELGWAKDRDGKVKSGDRVPGVAALQVQSAKVTSKTRLEA